jgi:hypothetical protein
MKASLGRRVCRIEQRCSAPRQTRFIWQDSDEGEDVVQARKRDMIASGFASPSDRFVRIGWRSPNPDKG